jgi:hypothetical protein
MSTFNEFMRETEREAEAEGPKAMAELQRFNEWFRKTRKDIRQQRVTVREHPLVAEYFITIEAPSQATPDSEIEHVEKIISAGLIAAGLKASSVEAISGILKALPEGYKSHINPLQVGVSCGACSRPVLEQVASAARSVIEMTEAMRRVEEHRMELVRTLLEIVKSADDAEDADR